MMCAISLLVVQLARRCHNGVGEEVSSTGRRLIVRVVECLAQLVAGVDTCHGSRPNRQRRWRGKMLQGYCSQLFGCGSDITASVAFGGKGCRLASAPKLVKGSDRIWMNYGVMMQPVLPN